ncbi:hypothetical protein CERSUDRAFT_96555 [Gelatoporia subvermispora B]|uniref:Uncharacterized protein n=1 Tax=Ceriporiopsis subvermispora (strain B) TaxID=914234 RepID=M2QEH3_CERS8|nr:hypothetical protein CERSUDRAFT_96555 [Gelatoporia subvermispora B]
MSSHPKPLTNLNAGTRPRGKGKGLAIGMVSAIAATLGYMYVAGVQTKREEGPVSIYKTAKEGGGNLNATTSDARMTSADVRATMQGERKP